MGDRTQTKKLKFYSSNYIISQDGILNDGEEKWINFEQYLEKVNKRDVELRKEKLKEQRE